MSHLTFDWNEFREVSYFSQVLSVTMGTIIRRVNNETINTSGMRINRSKGFYSRKRNQKYLGKNTVPSEIHSIQELNNSYKDLNGSKTE